MIDLTPDYNEKELYIGIRELINEKDNGNILVYNLKKVYSKINEISEYMYESFLEKAKNNFTTISVITEQGPGELVKRLVKDFDLHYFTWGVGGITAECTANKEQMKAIIQELQGNSKKYYASEEKKIFGNKTYIIPELGDFN